MPALSPWYVCNLRELNFSGLQLTHPFSSVSCFKIFSFAHLGSPVIFHIIEWKTCTEKNNYS